MGFVAAILDSAALNLKSLCPFYGCNSGKSTRFEIGPGFQIPALIFTCVTSTVSWGNLNVRFFIQKNGSVFSITLNKTLSFYDFPEVLR